MSIGGGHTDAGLFHFVIIKPSHYDDDGYPIQWFRSAIPSNTLACLNGLAEDARRRQVLGPGVEMQLHTYDETNRRVRPDRIIRMIRKAGGKALIGFVGVQSNQFPRAIDLARPFLAAGLPVCIGGFHISGCIAMLPEMPKEMQAAQAMGISFFAGEAEEGRLDQVLRDAFSGTLKPLYNYMDNLPSLEGEPPPALPKKIVQRTLGAISSLDLGRAALTSARSAPSSTCRDARAASATPTILSARFARTSRRASNASSSPTIISLATSIGKHCATA
jgi:hypothetical protein